MSQSGIYQIVNRLTGRRYVGATMNVQRRWAEHRSALRRGVHWTRAFQDDWNTYGSDAFSWEVLQILTDRDQLLIAEDLHIHQSEIPPYNTNGRSGTGPRRGYHHTAEARQKMSMAQKGHHKSPEWRRHLGVAHKGSTLSAEHRAAIGAGLRGHTDSPETKLKRRESLRRYHRERHLREVG